MSDGAPWLTTFNFEVLVVPRAAGSEESAKFAANFSEVSGLSVEMKTKSLREGGYNRGERQLVERTTHPSLVLKRGMTLDAGFWEWAKSCISGTYPLPYVDGTVNVYGHAGAEDWEVVATWKFKNAIATKVSAPTLDASGGGEVPIEELHLNHERLFRK